MTSLFIRLCLLFEPLLNVLSREEKSQLTKSELKSIQLKLKQLHELLNLIEPNNFN